MSMVTFLLSRKEISIMIFTHYMRTLLQEIGVIHNIPRTATIVTREHVECLVIDPDACLRIFPEAISKEFERRLEHMM